MTKPCAVDNCRPRVTGFRWYWRFCRVLAMVALLPAWCFRTAGQSYDKHSFSIPVLNEATNSLGSWMWDRETLDKQTCHFWRRFEIPRGTEVSHAQLRIAADNAYSVYLDGRELGRGSDWRTLSMYDLTWLLPPGGHVLAVEGFNDNDKAGVILGFRALLANGKTVALRSDTNWFEPPLNDDTWLKRRQPAAEWPHAIVVGLRGTEPWWTRPTQLVNVPPMYPVLVHFWQTGWFQIGLLVSFGLAGLTSLYLTMQLAVQSKAQRLLRLERARIARDIHDDLGARLTQLLLTGEEAQNRLAGESETRDQFDEMCEGARNVLGAIDEVVWVVNSQRDTLEDFVIYVCKYAETFLRSSHVRCRFDIQRGLPDISLELPVRRNLLLAIKEALRNAVKHASASEVAVRIRLQRQSLLAVVEDNGRGFEPSEVGAARNGLKNLRSRMNDLGGHFRVQSAPGKGCKIEFEIPITTGRLHLWQPFRKRLTLP